ncbi:MAG: tRNA (adenosine(37)-N6)-threonylcarbamoyltransferase complex ATPase subunit type 1 TsaE [Sinobacteraceae bacterium]|nr:tRNA (adenosine(37)-N6)-threonylcarbamoyltransferase complex ATPase subunit type 1 TsaE [Nevskiaceae bacterium]
MQCELSGAQATVDFGQRLAVARPQGKAFASIWLTGDLGAGKTTLARGFLRACGVSEMIRSPTYTLMEIHETPELTLLHLDLYRLSSPEELEPLGLREWAAPGCMWLIEWPERAPQLLPPADLLLRLTAGSNSHALVASAGSPLGESWLARCAGIELRQLTP